MSSSPNIRKLKQAEALITLKSRGSKITLLQDGTFEISEDQQRKLLDQIKSLVKLIGGYNVAKQVLRFLKDSDRFHDCFWWFGDRGLSAHHDKVSMLPVGWLFSIAIDALTVPGQARRPEVAWSSIVNLTTAFAALHDCQRYDQFDGDFTASPEIRKLLRDSIYWREFFSLAQVPRDSTNTIIETLEDCLKGNDYESLGIAHTLLATEVRQLLGLSQKDGFVEVPTSYVVQKFPTLLHFSKLYSGQNQPTESPLGTNRSYERNFWLDLDDRTKILLPSALLGASVCTIIFTSIHKNLGKKRADVIVQKVLETAVFKACTDMCPDWAGINIKSATKHENLECDVAAIDKGQFFLFECKAKSPTVAARNFDEDAYFMDFARSYLLSAEQLLRDEYYHERIFPHELLQNADPHPIAKIAVASLTLGPIQDRLLLTTILRGLVGRSVNSQYDQHRKFVNETNKTLEKITEFLGKITPEENGKLDIFLVLKNLFLLDLGQLLYLFQRAKGLADILKPITHLSFGSRDIWSEIAIADKQGLTTEHWKPIA